MLFRSGIPAVDAYTPRISPDGRFVAYQRRSPNDTHVYLFDRERQTVSRLTDSDADAQEWWYAWRPDGDAIAFNSSAEESLAGPFRAWEKDVLSAGVGGRLTADSSSYAPQEYTPDGSGLLMVRFNVASPTFDLDIVYQDFATGDVQTKIGRAHV